MGDTQGQDELEAAVRLLGHAALECVDEVGLDADALFARARGEQIGRERARALDAHLALCPHCASFLRHYDAERRAMTARAPDERRAKLRALEAEAARGAEAPVAPSRRLRRRFAPFALAGAVAAAALALVSLDRPVPPAAAEIGKIEGMAADTLGPGDEEPAPATAEPAVYTQHGKLEITVRLTDEQPRGHEKVAKLFAFVVEDGRLAAIDEAHVVQRTQSETWASMTVSAPATEVLGAEPGLHELWFASTYERDLDDLDGRPVSEVTGDGAVFWLKQRVELLPE